MAASIAVDSLGYPVIAGAFTGTLDLGGAPLEAPIPPGPGPLFDNLVLPLWGSFFLAKLAPAECAPVARVFSPMDRFATSIDVAVDPEGAILLSAAYSGAVDFGGGLRGSPDGSPSAVIARYGQDGEHLWSRGLTAPDHLATARPSSDAEGNVLAGGLFSGSLSVDGVTVGTSTAGLIDGFVVKLDSEGTLLWTRILRLSSKPAPAPPVLSIAAWPGGDVAASGQFVHEKDEPLDLGGGPPKSKNPYQTGFVTAFDASGQHRWGELLGPLIVDSRVDSKGTLVLLSGWNGVAFTMRRFDIAGAGAGNSSMPAPGGIGSMAIGPQDQILVGVSGPSLGGEMLAIQLGPAGEEIWSRSFPADGIRRVVPAWAPSGTPYLAGAFTISVDFGTGELLTNGDPDVFFATLAP